MALNTFQAAQRVRKMLIERYALEGEPECNLPQVWSKARSDESGFEFLRGCVNVVWEGEYDWPFWITEQIHAAKYTPAECGAETLTLPGIFCEAASGWALSFYND